jgi:hypothetical protein
MPLCNPYTNPFWDWYAERDSYPFWNWDKDENPL